MKKISFIILFFTLIQVVSAQDTLRVTLPQALDIALSESPTIKIDEKEIERVNYSQKSAWYGIIPSVEASGQFAKYLAPATMSLAGMTIELPTDYNATTSLTASLPLFAPALWHSIQMTTIEMQAAQEKAAANKINLKNEVTKAYYNVLVVQDSYDVLQDGYALTQKHYEIAKRGYEAGVLAAYDYISAEVQLNNLLPNIMQAENGIEQAKTYLKILMGMDVNVPIKVTNNLSDFEGKIVTVSSLSNLSLEENTDLRQLEIGRLQLQKSLQMQRSQRMPMLAAFGQYGYAGTANKAGNNPFTGMYAPANESWYSQGLLVGLQLNIPLTGIFTNIAKEKQLIIQDQELELQREQAKNALHLQAVSALDRMNKAVKQVDAATKSVDLSEKALEISSKRYENGAGTMVELQNASLAVTQSRLSYHQAISEYLTAKADLEKILGREVR